MEPDVIIEPQTTLDLDLTLETAVDMELAKAFVKTDRFGKPKCRCCQGKGFLVKHLPLEGKQFTKMFRQFAEFCPGPNCSETNIKLIGKDKALKMIDDYRQIMMVNAMKSKVTSDGISQTTIG